MCPYIIIVSNELIERLKVGMVKNTRFRETFQVVYFPSHRYDVFGAEPLAMIAKQVKNEEKSEILPPIPTGLGSKYCIYFYSGDYGTKKIV